MPYDHGWMWGGGVGMVFGALWMVLIWIVPLVLLVALIKYLLTKPPRDVSVPPASVPGTSALDILKAAYARGEISREEYLQKRDDLLEK